MPGTLSIDFHKLTASDTGSHPERKSFVDKQIKNTAIDEYIAQRRPEVKDIMREIRDVIKRAAPNARKSDPGLFCYEFFVTVRAVQFHPAGKNLENEHQ